MSELRPGAAGRLRSVAGVRTAALALALGGCGVHGSAVGWEAGTDAPRDRGPAIVVVGNGAGSPARARAVANRVDASIRDELSRGRAPVVLWLGDMIASADTRPRCDRPGAWPLQTLAGPGPRTLAIAGVGEWRCRAGRIGGDDAAREPSRIVRIDRTGAPRRVSHCADGVAACIVEPAQPGRDLLELVMLDLPPRPIGTDAEPAAAASARRQARRLLTALAPAGPGVVPRLLVSHLPVECAGPHGLGAGPSDATFHHLDPAVRAHVQAGTFAGVVSARDRSLQIIPDLDHAVRRADKAALHHPVFQVVVGTSGDVRRRHRAAYFEGISASPTVYSTAPGFVVLRPDQDRIEIVVHARRRGWHRSTLSLPLRPPARPVETRVGSMAPCLRCPQVPADDRP